jgi:thiaminase
MYKESIAMKELHKIRENMHEATKNMTTKEYTAYIHKVAERAEGVYGLHLRKVSRPSRITS